MSIIVFCTDLARDGSDPTIDAHVSSSESDSDTDMDEELLWKDTGGSRDTHAQHKPGVHWHKVQPRESDPSSSL